MLESLAPEHGRLRLFRSHEFSLLVAILAVVVLTGACL